MHDIRHQTGRIEVSPDALHAAAAKCDDQIEEVRLDEAADDARFAAITDAIAQLSRQSADQVNNDPVVTQLQQVVDARQKELDAVSRKHQMGQETEIDVDAAAGAVAEAKAQLALQRQQATAAAGGDMLMALQKELISVTIDQQEIKAKRSVLDREETNLPQALDDVDELAQYQVELQRLRAEYYKVEDEIDQAEMQSR
ncbi:MAG TPA: hypothetical protein VMD30_08755 [Tepidisphaeraceae bacterium]|nr:hypothetical protein [Tepidisphaeraceae bacterium]